MIIRCFLYLLFIHMASLKEVRTRIKSVKSTQQITKAMKMVAAAKLRRAQDKIIQLRPYADMLGTILQNLSASMTDEELQSEYAEEREPNKVLIVSITSDRGLCGAFNANIIKASKKLAEGKYASQLAAGNVHFLHFGKKAYESLKKQGYQTNGDFVDIFQNLSFDKVKEAGDFILEQFKSGEYDRVELVYNEFKNVIVQIVREVQFLPIQENTDTDKPVKASSSVDYLLEPSREEIIEELIPKSLKIQLYRAVLESNAAEQGARMSSMDSATENAESLLKDLKLTYNQTRQAAITKEILEIVGGAEALKG